MGYYNGSLIIHNETPALYKNEDENIINMKFSMSFNKQKLYLNNNMLFQILKSPAVQKYILKECNTYSAEHKIDIENKISKLLTTELQPKASIRIFGKFMMLRVICGRNHTIKDCLNSISIALNNEKSQIDSLKG